MSIGGVLNLDLVHSMDASWSQMQDVRLFLYEVVGHYSPPLPEDMFQRLEDAKLGEDEEFRSEEHMRAEEALVGLKFLQAGSVKVEQLIGNRIHPLIPTSDNAHEGIPRKFAAWANRSQVTTCHFEPQNDKPAQLASPTTPAQPGGLTFTKVDVLPEAYRVLPADSRWFKCVAMLSTMGIKANQYFHEHTITKVQVSV